MTKRSPPLGDGGRPARRGRTNPSSSALVDIVGPWCKLLRDSLGAAMLPSAASTPRCTRWLSVRLPVASFHLSGLDRRRQQLREVLNSIALLSVVAQVDPDAWRYLLAYHCNLAQAADDVCEPGKSLRFLIHADMGQHANEVFLTQKDFISALEMKADSDEFVETLERVVAHGEDAGVNLARPCQVAIALHFAAFSQDGYDAATLVSHVGNPMIGVLVRKQVDCDPLCSVARCEQQTCCFGFTSLLIDAISMRVTEPDTATLLSFVDCKTPCAAISLVIPSTTEQFSNNGEVVRAVMTTLLCGRSTCTVDANDDVEPLVRVGGMDFLSFLCDGCSVLSFGWLCSAIASATEIRELVLERAFCSFNTDDSKSIETKRKWQWLSYAVFSRASQSSIRALTIDGVELRRKHVKLVADVLATNHPHWETGDVWQRSASKSPIEYVRIPKHCPVQMHLLDMREKVFTGVETLYTTDAKTVQLVDDNGLNSEVTIVVPGYGYCSVDRHNISQPIAQITDEGRGDVLSQGIGELAIEFAVASASSTKVALVRLLSLVGSRLFGLALGSSCPTTIDLDQVLRRCPRLQRLSFSNTRVELEAPFAVSRSKITSLSFVDSDMVGRGFKLFVDRLAVRSTHEARYLEELRVTSSIYKSTLDAKRVELLVNMLMTNSKLITLVISLERGLISRYEQALSVLDKQPVEERRASQIRRNIAFLSVIHKFRISDSDPKAVARLDRRVLAHILRFSVCLTPRRVVLKKCDDRTELPSQNYHEDRGDIPAFVPEFLSVSLDQEYKLTSM